MRVLFVGDIFGRAGRKILVDETKPLKKKLSLDLVIANGENAAGGAGITPTIAKEFYEAGVDGITLGNHAFNEREIFGHINNDNKMVRPINYPKHTTGKGNTILETARGKKALIMNAMARLFMDPLDDPFPAVEDVLKKYPLGSAVHFTLIDFHGEATSEKQIFANVFDGRASLIAGTHTHVPTADARILPNGTAYQTDVGMTGDYDSIIGSDYEEPRNRLLNKISQGRLKPAMKAATLCGIMVETDDKTGLPKQVSRLVLGPHLENVLPEF